MNRLLSAFVEGEMRVAPGHELPQQGRGQVEPIIKASTFPGEETDGQRSLAIAPFGLDPLLLGFCLPCLAIVICISYNQKMEAVMSSFVPLSQEAKAS